MSILFGIHETEGQRVTDQKLIELATATSRYALDGTFVWANGPIGMAFQPYYTNQRSHLESKPSVDGRGNLATFDGRIDNHAELRQLLGIVDTDTPDSLIVLQAFERWGEHCFAKLIGDWSLALWANSERSLYLARDHAGTRTLYFEHADGTLLWSTYLETFFVGGRRHAFDEDYAACYLACQPIRDLTPYQGIKAIPPAHYLVFNKGKVRCKPHWQWIRRASIRYKSGNEYEEHFLSLFEQSVERRTGPGEPILAELSGGMDSSSIVCMSDFLKRTKEPSNKEILDTVSYYNDTEPNWDEKPFFTAVEAKRGKQGIHMDTSIFGRVLKPIPPPNLLPGHDHNSFLQEVAFQELLGDKEYRVILSGVGGDELLGGVPSANPELADHLVRGQLRALFSRGIEWSLPNRAPLIRLLLSTAKFTLDTYRRPGIEWNRVPPWIPSCLRSRCHQLQLRGLEQSTTIRCRPTAIENGRTWWHIMETLPHLARGFLGRREYRYPYLDRDLVEFLHSAPREELAQPGRRRFLMRKALKTIVPSEVIERRRKGFLIRKTLQSLQMNKDDFHHLLKDSVLLRQFSIHEDRLLSAFGQTLQGQDIRWWPGIDRFVLLELWLRSRQENPISISPVC